MLNVMQRGREHCKIQFVTKYHKQYHCVIGGLSTALGNPSWASDQDFLLLINSGKKLKRKTLRQQINEQYGERVAIPYTSEKPTSINL
jgi:hypothetical protein